MIDVSFVVPAFNEGSQIESTLQALQTSPYPYEIIVIDDGSVDDTKERAKQYANTVLSLKTNKGKGYALQMGWQIAKGSYIVSVDADLKGSAIHIMSLLPPLLRNEADVSIAIVTPGSKSGMGFVKRRAQAIILKRTGEFVQAPLSGQRAFHRKWLSHVLTKKYYRYGVETKMMIDLLQAGATYVEIQSLMTHREMGRGLKGSIHRFKQWLQIEWQCLRKNG